MGRVQVTEGALVSAGAATLLTQINQLSPISAVFTQSNTAILDFAQQVRAGTLKMPDAARVEVRLILANGQEYGEPSTGTQTIRAQFANASRTLPPGQFVRGRIVTGIQKTGIRVPERAIQLDGSSASVALVGPDGTLLRRNVQVGAQEQGQWVVLDGLQPGGRAVPGCRAALAQRAGHL